MRGPPLPLFTHLIHADWSTRPQGRWMAEAVATGDGWRLTGPRPVGPLDALVAEIMSGAPLLAGFDMPIGLPAAFGRRTGLPDYPTALQAFGEPSWPDFYHVAASPDEIGIGRPFYPARPGPRGTTLHRHLAEGHGMPGVADLRRRCERGADGDRTASPLFWTLGPNAVGKAAIHGWQAAIAPAARRGAALWPFDGDLAALARTGRPVLAETYPADVYPRLGFPTRGWSKARLADRRALGPVVVAWMAARGIAISEEMTAAIDEGFDARHGGDDGFDAVVGLLGMIAVVDGERGTGLPVDADVTRWEGWILGRGG